MNVLGTGNLGFDDRQVLRVGQAVGLHRIRLGGRGHQRRGVLGAVTALGQAFVCQAQAELQLVAERVELLQALVKALDGSIAALSTARRKGWLTRAPKLWKSTV